MKKINSILLLFTVISLCASAQQNKTYNIGQLYPGYVVTVQNDTVKGFIVNGDKEQNQKKCNFFTNAEDAKTKKTYKPSELKEYAIEDNHYRSLDYSGNLSFGKPGRSFLLITSPGYINTYVYYLDGEQIVWQKADEAPVSNASMLLSFKKSVLKLVGDDADIAGKVERKEKGYGMLSVMSIVNEYNTRYAARK